MTSANAIAQAAADGEAASALDVLEVLYRNGHRKAPVKLGVATPIVQGGSNRILVGAAGDRPKDQAKTYALMSLVIMAVAAVAAPVIAAIVFFTS